MWLSKISSSNENHQSIINTKNNKPG
jgi:hypothetical protein